MKTIEIFPSFNCGLVAVSVGLIYPPRPYVYTPMLAGEMKFSCYVHKHPAIVDVTKLSTGIFNHEEKMRKKCPFIIGSKIYASN